MQFVPRDGSREISLTHCPMKKRGGMELVHFDVLISKMQEFWWPSQQVLSQNCTFSAPKQPFLVQISLGTHSKRTNEGSRLLHPPCGLTSLCQSALYLHDMSQKRPQKERKSPKNQRTLATNSPTHEWAISWATWLKNQCRGNPIHPQPPTLCRFHLLEVPNETPRTPYWCSLGVSRG